MQMFLVSSWPTLRKSSWARPTRNSFHFDIRNSFSLSNFQQDLIVAEQEKDATISSHLYAISKQTEKDIYLSDGDSLYMNGKLSSHSIIFFKFKSKRPEKKFQDLNFEFKSKTEMHKKDLIWEQEEIREKKFCPENFPN